MLTEIHCCAMNRFLLGTFSSILKGKIEARSKISLYIIEVRYGTSLSLYLSEFSIIGYLLGKVGQMIAKFESDSLPP